MSESNSKKNALLGIYKNIIEVIQKSSEQYDSLLKHNAEHAVRDHGTPSEHQSMENAKRSLAMSNAAHSVGNSAIEALRRNWDIIIGIATKD